MSEMTAQSGKGFFDGNPKTMFVFGIVSGIAIILTLQSLVGVVSAAGAFAGGKSGGARTVLNTNPTPSGNDVAPAPAGELAAVQPDEHIRGDLKKAKVVMVEYSDFECPFCAKHHPTMQQVMDEYGDKVAWVYRHFPLSFHPQAQPAAIASECASEQGKFWEYGDALVANQAKLGDAYYKQLAGELKLNMTKFNDCLSTKKYAEVVSADAASGQAAGVNGTPATFINGQLVSGAVPYETFKQMIDAELAK